MLQPSNELVCAQILMPFRGVACFCLLISNHLLIKISGPGWPFPLGSIVLRFKSSLNSSFCDGYLHRKLLVFRIGNCVSFSIIVFFTDHVRDIKKTTPETFFY